LLEDKHTHKIVIKIGSNVLTREDKQLDIEVIKGLVNQIAELKRQKYVVVLVSSGAVAAGKSIYSLKNEDDITTRRQVYSSIGQVHLMNLYYELFAEHQLNCAQVLATKDDFLGGERYKNMKNCFEGLLRDDIIPIVNENDVVSLSALMFTDNDELAGLTAFLIQAPRLIILSNIDGFYDGNPDESNSKVIPTIKSSDDFSHLIQSSKSDAGRGGMASKYDIGVRSSEKGISTTIANGKKENVVLDIINLGNVGTTFLID